MSRRALAVYAAAAALVLGSGPGLSAQDRPNPGQQSSQGSAGARPNPSGGSSGSAVSRPSGGGSSGGSTSSAGSSSSSGGGSVSGGGSDGGGSSYRRSAPERRPDARAVPRDQSSPRSGENRRVAPGGSTTLSPAPDNSDDRRRAVPAGARPRDGRTAIGSATDRRFPPPTRGDDRGWGYYDPYNRYSYYYSRYPYGYAWPGYGYGIGYFYDPWMWGYFSPYHDPYYSGAYGGGYSYRSSTYRPVGGLRLKVQPRDGQVFVDGYFVGEVDSFDGVFQRLSIEEGPHRIEIRAPGFETVQFEVMVIPGETVTYKGELKRIQ